MTSFFTKLISLTLLVGLATSRSRDGPQYRPGEPIPEDDGYPHKEGAPGHARQNNLGFACPFPPDQYGNYPSYCYDVVGKDCECINDDVRLTQNQCVILHGRDAYGKRITSQMHLERERGQSYEYLWDCYESLFVEGRNVNQG